MVDASKHILGLIASKGVPNYRIFEKLLIVVHGLFFSWNLVSSQLGPKLKKYAKNCSVGMSRDRKYVQEARFANSPHNDKFKNPYYIPKLF